MKDRARRATSNAALAGGRSARGRALRAATTIVLATLTACRRDSTSGAPAPSATVFVPRPAPSGPGTPRPGMAWIPPGTVRVGTPPDRTPRIADEELAHDERQMGGFYIDLYPYPDEAGAIPTTNVTRDEAARLCEARGKRLCTELEWERACKGAENSPYEYGDAYRAASCGTGVAAEEGARRPTGDHVACKSSFGVADMHGGPWEWTDSRWQRGPSAAPGPARDGGARDLAVLRGGNAALGELVGRCANARGSPSGSRALTVGFRCCAGPRNSGSRR